MTEIEKRDDTMGIDKRDIEMTSAANDNSSPHLHAFITILSQDCPPNAWRNNNVVIT